MFLKEIKLPQESDPHGFFSIALTSRAGPSPAPQSPQKVTVLGRGEASAHVEGLHVSRQHRPTGDGTQRRAGSPWRPVGNHTVSFRTVVFTLGHAGRPTQSLFNEYTDAGSFNGNGFYMFTFSKYSVLKLIFRRTCRKPGCRVGSLCDRCSQQLGLCLHRKGLPTSFPNLTCSPLSRVQRAAGHRAEGSFKTHV